ncbi:MAG: hypothetical protein ABI588_04240, partial [Arenimonas sp.]
LAATVTRPDAKTKAEWLAKIQALPSETLPFSKLRVAMGALYPAGQETLSDSSAQQRVDTLARIDASADRVFMRSYAASMIPATCTADSVARLQAAAKSLDGLSDGVRRDLLSTLEDDSRCVAIRAKFEASLHD